MTAYSFLHVSASKQGHHVTLLGEDIVSAFNNVRTKECVELIEAADPTLADYVRRFLASRKITIWWYNCDRGPVQMDQGCPQGSPLSPVLWLINLARTLKKTQQWFDLTKKLHSHVTRHKHSEQQGRRELILVSYIDDISPMIITSGTLAHHRKTV